jgi:ribonuclease P protein component
VRQLFQFNEPIPAMHPIPTASLWGERGGAPRTIAPSMDDRRRERLTPADRIRTGNDFARVKAGATTLRGAFCMALVLRTPGEATRVGWIASKRSVGGAVQRNRARRRLREILRRRWPRLSPSGFAIVFIAFRGILGAAHEALVGDVERLLVQAGALNLDANAD